MNYDTVLQQSTTQQEKQLITNTCTSKDKFQEHAERVHIIWPDIREILEEAKLVKRMEISEQWLSLSEEDWEKEQRTFWSDKIYTHISHCCSN